MRLWYAVIGVGALLTPVILALAVLPTAASDTRELLAWGQFFAFSTDKHPPMMQWMGGLTRLTLGSTAFAAVMVTQALNAAGLAYTYATARLAVERDRAALFTLMLASSLYIVVAPLPFALNADVLQFPFWAAAVYHALKAASGNRPLHWMCLSLACAAAFYTKYSALVLFASLAVASLAVPQYRAIWRRWQVYAALAAVLVLALPNLVASEATHAVGHAARLFDWDSSLTARALGVGQIASGLLLWLAPAWVIIGIGLARGDCLWDVASSPPARFLRAAAAAGLAMLVLLVLVAGLNFESRYIAPMLFLAVLGAASLIGFDRTRWPGTQLRSLRAAAGVPVLSLAIASTVYLRLASHDYMQEPIGAAAAAIKSEWDGAYTCGPAYIMGDVWSAYGLAIASRPPIAGVPLEVMDRLPWFDHAELERHGAIVVWRQHLDDKDDLRPEIISGLLPNVTLSGLHRLQLPLLRSAGAQVAYDYVFIPPAGCQKLTTN